MRPTGKLHIGHLVGALKNWAALQDQYDCFYFVADWHALTSEYANTSEIAANAIDNAADWIAAGVDPERSTLFIQSLVPEHAELYLLLQMVVPIPWLERVPTYKEQREQLSEKDLSTVGFLGYPLLQTADVALYDGRFVPVGEDQVAHLELSREAIRRFHQFYGNPVFMYHDVFNTDAAEVEDLKTRYRAGKVGDVEVKTKLARAMNASLAPMRERRREVMARPERVREILIEGSRKARGVAQVTMERVREAVKLRY
jgi:tryptophanyl-tRNA synthetase